MKIGTMTGIGTYFKDAKSDVFRIAYVPHLCLYLAYANT
jgi:cysteine synthase